MRSIERRINDPKITKNAKKTLKRKLKKLQNNEGNDSDET